MFSSVAKSNDHIVMNLEIVVLEQPDLFDVGDRDIAQTFCPPVDFTPYPLGTGPKGETCGSCRYKARKSKRYLKCVNEKRRMKNTNGKGTDIKARWRCCAAWRPRIAIEDEASELQVKHKIPLELVADLIAPVSPDKEKLIRLLLETDHKPLTEVQIDALNLMKQSASKNETIPF